MQVKLKAGVLLGVVITLAGCRSASAPREGEAQPNAVQTQAAYSAPFDLYLLNLSWSPEFCYSHPQAAECAAHPAFVLHGLWPENADGSYPDSCSDAPGPADPAQFADIYPDAGLLAHEWHAHGTCSGMPPEAFFAAARTAYRAVKIPPALAHLHEQATMTPYAIVDAFTSASPGLDADAVRVSCGHNFLTAVEVCLDKSLHPMGCPAAVRSCRANVVRIPPP